MSGHSDDSFDKGSGAETVPAKDRTGCIVFCAVLGAFLLLIGAWVFFFWIAGKNRIEEVPNPRQERTSNELAPAAGNLAFSDRAASVHCNCSFSG